MGLFRRVMLGSVGIKVMFIKKALLLSMMFFTLQACERSDSGEVVTQWIEIASSQESLIELFSFERTEDHEYLESFYEQWATNNRKLIKLGLMADLEIGKISENKDKTDEDKVLMSRFIQQEKDLSLVTMNWENRLRKLPLPQRISVNSVAIDVLFSTPTGVSLPLQLSSVHRPENCEGFPSPDKVDTLRLVEGLQRDLFVSRGERLISFEIIECHKYSAGQFGLFYTASSLVSKDSYHQVMLPKPFSVADSMFLLGAGSISVVEKTSGPYTREHSGIMRVRKRGAKWDVSASADKRLSFPKVSTGLPLEVMRTRYRSKYSDKNQNQFDITFVRVNEVEKIASSLNDASEKQRQKLITTMFSSGLNGEIDGSGFARDIKVKFEFERTEKKGDTVSFSGTMTHYKRFRKEIMGKVSFSGTMVWEGIGERYLKLNFGGDLPLKGISRSVELYPSTEDTLELCLMIMKNEREKYNQRIIGYSRTRRPTLSNNTYLVEPFYYACNQRSRSKLFPLRSKKTIIGRNRYHFDLR